MQLKGKHNLEMLRTSVEDALSSIADTLGVKFKAGQISYDVSGERCTIKLEVTAPNDSGEFVSKERRELEQAKAMLYPWLDLDTPFTARGETFRLVGYKSRSPKFPFILENEDGTRIKVTEGWLRSRMFQTPSTR